MWMELKKHPQLPPPTRFVRRNRNKQKCVVPVLPYVILEGESMDYFDMVFIFMATASPDEIHSPHQPD